MAVIAAAALLVSGCSSSEEPGGKDDKGGGKPDASEPADKSAAPEKDESADGGGTGSDQDSEAPSDGKPASLEGIWKAKGKQFVLTIAGNAVTMLREESKNCTGRVMDSGGKTLVLKCPGGTGEDRTNGRVGELKAKSMKVSWNGGATDVYAKVADSPVKLPEDPEKLVPKG